MTFVVVGGAIDKTLLGPIHGTDGTITFFSERTLGRGCTSDEDSYEQRVLADQRPSLRGDWFEESLSLRMDPAIRRRLVTESMAQNVAVLRCPGLTLLAPPFAYQFVAKWHCHISTSPYQEQVFAAAAYLKRFTPALRCQAYH